MKKGGSIILLLLVIVSAAFGQTSYAFKVLANKGTNEVKSGGAWSAVKTGASLQTTDELRLASNSYIALVHVTGKPIELKEPGTYKIADLSSKVPAGSGVVTKYTDFILSSNSAEARKNRLSATGAVHRGPETVEAHLLESVVSEVYNSNLIISWEKWKGGGPYVLTVKSLFDDDLQKVETNDTWAQINLAAPEFAGQNTLMVVVRAKSDIKTAKSYTIKKMTPAAADKVKKELAEFGPDFTTANVAVNKVVLASYYESNKLLVDAVTAYEQLLKIAPDVVQFKEDYEDFLIRNKLKFLPKK